MQNYHKAFILHCCMSLLIIGCGRSPHDANTKYTESASEQAYSKDAVAASAVMTENMMQSHANQNQKHTTIAGKQRQFIKTANASFHVNDVYKTALTLEDMAISHGGFVTHNSVSNNIQRTRTIKTDNGVQTVVEEYQPVGLVTLRIPQKELQQFLRAIVKHTEFMYSRNFDAKDVVLDILKEQQLAKINASANTQLNQNTNTDGTTLDEKVYATNASVAYQHTKLLAEIQKAELEDKVAFSTLTLELQQSPLVRTYTQNYFPYAVEQAQPSFAYKVEESIEAGWEHFLVWVIGAISLWPFAIFFIVVFFAWRKLRTWWKQRKLNRQKASNKP